MKIQTKIDISFSQEDITKLLTAEVEKELPGVVVHNIELIARRKGSGVEAVVDADLKGTTSLESLVNTPPSNIPTYPVGARSMEPKAEVPEVGEEEPGEAKQEIVAPAPKKTIAELLA